tara:strand:+ start:823 stop:1056 length:234 start_codon:yes stop_codon:yes gene_type:complete
MIRDFNKNIIHIEKLMILFTNIIMNNDYKKLIDVIKSMSSILHYSGTRNYIDLYYKKNGIVNKEMIEYYFKVKKKNL